MRCTVEDVVTQTSATVSTSTALQAWVNAGDGSSKGFASLLFYLINQDATSSVTMVIETSEDGVHPDQAAISITATPGKQVSHEVGPYQLRSYWRLSATTSGSNVPVKFGIRGAPRIS
jgi:hypothetical protein